MAVYYRLDSAFNLNIIVKGDLKSPLLGGTLRIGTAWRWPEVAPGHRKQNGRPPQQHRVVECEYLVLSWLCIVLALLRNRDYCWVSTRAFPKVKTSLLNKTGTDSDCRISFHTSCQISSKLLLFQSEQYFIF